MWLEHIEQDNAILDGKPHIRGTNITVAQVMHWLDKRQPIEDILGLYPGLTRNQILACISYASRHFTIHV
jgi:uncharacterized protein (DUF433 family)